MWLRRWRGRDSAKLGMVTMWASLAAIKVLNGTRNVAHYGGLQTLQGMYPFALASSDELNHTSLSGEIRFAHVQLG